MALSCAGVFWDKAKAYDMFGGFYLVLFKSEMTTSGYSGTVAHLGSAETGRGRA
jgi:hypothetical protein